MATLSVYLGIISAISTPFHTSPTIAVSATLMVSAWVSWWLWRFVLRPRLHPEEAREFPYLVPLLGHTLSFIFNSTELVTRARLGLGDTREPFSITLAGSKIYILTKPKDVVEAYRNMTTFSYDIFVQEMMRWCGSSEPCIRDMYKPAPDALFHNPKSMPLAVLARDMHIHQLFPGQNLDILAEKFYDYFSANLLPDRITARCPAYQHGQDELLVPFNTWISDNFVRAGTGAYFGDALIETDEGLIDVFLEFDDLSWQILYQWPRTFASRMYRVRDRLTASIERYFDLPQEQRPCDAWFTKAMEDDMRKAGIGTHDIATMMMTIHWGINTNTRRACFWMLSYLIQDPALLDEVRIETGKAWSADGVLDRHCLMEGCPRLESVWNETIRLSASSASVRYVAEDTVIRGKVLRKGNRIMIPNRQLHMDEGVFGPVPMQFNPDRFYQNAKLLRSPSWRPFGGGITMCPGRFIAKQASFMFTALLLARFKVSKADERQPFPTQDTGTPVLGVMMNKPGTEFIVRLQTKKSTAPH